MTQLQLASLRPVLIPTLLALTCRNGFRLYEYSMQYVRADERATQVILNEEWQFYVFEFIPVYLVHVIFCVWNFGWLLPSDEVLAASLASTPVDSTVVVHSKDSLGAYAAVVVASPSVMVAKVSPANMPESSSKAAAAASMQTRGAADVEEGAAVLPALDSSRSTSPQAATPL